MRMDMSGETEIKRKVLLPEGERVFIIKSCEESTSKSGNTMMVFTLIDKVTNYEDKLFCVSVPKKRFMLKQVLNACGVPAGADGIYEFEIADLLNKEILGVVSHEPNEFINRDGITVKGTQHRINEIKTLAWDDAQ